MSEATQADAAFIRQFEQCELSGAAFDNRAHVRAARWYLRRYGLVNGSGRFVDSLRRFVVHHGATEKYHDTLTKALLHIIDDLIADGPDDESWPEFCNRCEVLLDTPKALIARHYSKSLLASGKARKQFVYPNRHPLPNLNSE